MKLENRVCKYELSKILKPMMIFYVIYFFVIITIKILGCFLKGVSGTTSGTDLSTIVFVGIIALTILKQAFKFSQGNNISRNKFIEGTIKRQKTFKLVGGILIIGISLFVYINNSDGYTYIKYNGNLYIITGETSENVGEYLGKVESKVPLFTKPLIDSQSNGFPIGTELYSGGKGGVSMLGEQTEYIYVKFDEKYWYLYNSKTMGALNGYKVKIRNGKVELE